MIAAALLSVRVKPPVFCRRIVLVSLIVRPPMLMLLPSTMLDWLLAPVAERVTDAVEPGIRGVGTAPAESVVQLLAVVPLEADHTLTLPERPPFQKAALSAVCGEVVTCTKLSVELTPVTVKLVLL